MSRKKPQSAMAALLDFSDNTLSEDITTTVVESDEKVSEIKKVNTFNDPFLNESRILEISPDECILWPYADRPIDELGDIESLATSIKQHGQQEPVLIRRNKQNTNHKYEIIFGNRRWRASQQANTKLLAVFKDLSDQQAALCQKEENENRKELSDYARALSYKSQIDGGVFKSETELSKFLGISKQTLNDIMSFLRVPEILRDKIKGYKYLSKKMVTKLASLSKDKDKLDVLIHLADKIGDKIITTSNIDEYVHKFLTPKNTVKNLENKFLIKKTASGKTLLKTQKKANGDIYLKIDKGLIKENNLEEVHLKIANILEDFI